MDIMNEPASGAGSGQEVPAHCDGAAGVAPTPARNLPLVVMAVLAVIFVLHWAQSVFIPVVLGLVVSYALSPLLTKLHTWHVPRAIGAALLLLGIVGGVGALAYSLKDEASAMIETLPDAAQKLREAIRKEWGTPKSAIENMQKAAEQIEHAASETAVLPPVVPRGVTRVQIEEPRLRIRDYLWDGTIGVLSFMTLAVMVLFMTYFLMVSGDTFRRKLVKFSGPTLGRKKDTVQMLNEISAQVQRYLMVQVLTSVIVGISIWLAFLWVGLENAAVWGVAAAILNLVPYLGPILITGGTALVAFLQFGNMSMALMVASISILINALEGFLLMPWLTGHASRMNPVVVFVGILFWGWLWGAWGLLLGMPIMMAVKAVCDHVDEFKSAGDFMGV